MTAGSFFNVVIHRVPRMIFQSSCHQYNLFFPRSHCPECYVSLCWYHNIPVLSWLCLRGKCHSCKTDIAVSYPLTELLFMITALLMSYYESNVIEIIFTFFFCGTLLSLALIDLRYTLLPDMLTLPLLWGGLLFHTLPDESGLMLQDAVFGAVAGYMTLWLLYWIFYALTGREGLGGGDFKLLAALGAWSGWKALPIILLLAASTGIIMVFAARVLKNKKFRDEIPFGPSLAFAGLVCHFF
ncbi:prepilin peptidase [Erwinia psidii]